jgi:gluconate 5-dehydrogenase
MSHPLIDIAGRVALVTGSSRGIGYALADGLLAAGCTVIVNSRSPAACAEAAQALRASHPAGVVHAAPFDVTDEADVRAAVAAAEDAAGPVDIAVCNAGIQHRAPALELSAAAWQQVIATNLTGPFLVGREAGARMAARGRGKIINICSVQSELARPGIAAYTAAKGGLKMLTKAMCAELAPLGIQVNGLGPGYLRTDLTAALTADQDFSAWLTRRTPAGRWGEVGDLVGTLLFLASPASDFVNGQVIYVDGGLTAVV